MPKKISIIIICVLFIAFSCANLFNSDDEQENIRVDWPSLLDSPWPMWGGDPLQTYCAIYAGPEVMTDTSWLFRTIPGGIHSGMVIGKDDAIFVTTSHDKSLNPSASYGAGILHCLDRNGNLIWKTIVTDDGATNGEILNSPVLLSDGSVLVNAYDQSLTRVLENGTVLWHYNQVAEGLFPGLFITRAGDLLMVDVNAAWCLKNFSPNAVLNSIITRSFIGGIAAFLPNGSRYLTCSSDSVFCLDLAGNIIWRYYYKNKNKPTNPGTLAVNRKGEIFCYNWLDSTLTCLDKNGIVKWKQPISKFGNFTHLEPNMAIDKDENLVLSLVDPNRGLDNDHAALVSASRTGKLRWRTYLDTPVEFYELIVDAQGKTYCVDGTKIYCLSPTGNILWTLNYSGSYHMTTMNLAINSRGELIVCFDHGVLRVR